MDYKVEGNWGTCKTWKSYATNFGNSMIREEMTERTKI